jgi:hypothetical protein
MIKSLFRPSKPYEWGLCTATLSGSGPKQCWSYTNSSRNLASQRSSISTSLSSRGKFQSSTKLQDLGTMKISKVTPNQYTTLILTAVGHQKIGRRTSEHLHKKDILGPPTKDSHRVAKEAVHQIGAEVATEALTHSNLRTACIMTVKPTTAAKIVPFSLSQKEKWSKIPQSLHNNPHPEKSTTQCNAPHHQQYSSSYPSLLPPQPYQNTQIQPLAYYKSYHYATTNHP